LQLIAGFKFATSFVSHSPSSFPYATPPRFSGIHMSTRTRCSLR
jgi:hypothetical protein